MYQALTNGQGGMNLADYSYLKEEGLAGQTPDGRSSLQAVMEQVNKMPISGRYRLMAASNLTGLSMHQYEGLENAFMKDGKFDMAKLGIDLLGLGLSPATCVKIAAIGSCTSPRKAMATRACRLMN